jgi:hypothetical protein
MALLEDWSDLWTRYECPVANLVASALGRPTPILEFGFAAISQLNQGRARQALSILDRDRAAARVNFGPQQCLWLEDDRRMQQ